VLGFFVIWFNIMKNIVISNEQEYDAALERLNVIFHAEPNSREGLEADALVESIEKYEEVYYPIIQTTQEIF